MFTTKESLQIKRILIMLLDNEIVTTKQIAEDVVISEKTVRLRLNSLNDFLVENGIGSIQRKTRVGVWLELIKGMEFKIQDLLNLNNASNVPNSDNRLASLLNIFMSDPEKSFTLKYLADELFMSIPTLSKLIEEAAYWFENYNMVLEKQPNRGHWLRFNEIDLRIAYRDFLVQNIQRDELDARLSQYIKGINVEYIRNTIIANEDKWDIKLTDKAFVNILILLAIMVSRNSKGNYLDFPIDQTMITYSEYRFIKSIVEGIDQRENLIKKDGEIHLVSMELLFNNTLKADEKDILFEHERDKLDSTVTRMIDALNDILSVDLTNDTVLRQGLMLHLQPAIFRMKYGYSHSNVQSMEIRKNYQRVYRAVWATGIIIEDEYDVQINENEIAFIVLYIQAAIERQSNPMNFVLVSSKSNAQNEFLRENLRKRVIGDVPIKVISYHTFNSEIIKKYDVVITTENIEKKYCHDKIIRVSPILTDADIRNLNHHINMQLLANNNIENCFSELCHTLFDPDLVFRIEKVDSKEDALEEMTNALQRKQYVTDNYFNTVVNREKLSQTSIGNGVAIPHGSQEDIIDAKVAVMILDDPVQWTEEETVVIIFLLAMKMDTKENSEITKLFYKQYINLVSDDKNVVMLQNLKSNIEVYNFLVS